MIPALNGQSISNDFYLKIVEIDCPFKNRSKSIVHLKLES